MRNLLLLLLLLAFKLASSTEEDPFIVQTDDLPRLEDGSIDTRLLPALGNGHLATNAYSDALFVNGVYNGYLGDSHRGRIQSLFASQWDACSSDGGERLFTLDMRQAFVEEVLTCPDVTVTQRLYAHAQLDRLLVTEVALERNEGSTGTEVEVFRADLSGEQSDEDFEWQEVEEIQEGLFYKTGRSLEPETDDSGSVDVHVYYNVVPPESVALPEGEDEAHFVFLLSVDVDDERAREDIDEGLTLLDEDPTGASLRSGHVDSWSSTWSAGNILLEGDGVDTFLKESVASSLYYIYCSLPSSSSSSSDFYGLSPGGLARGEAGNDYQGHVFWDMETWMYPPVLLFRPDLAKAMLNYRIRGIEEARDRAQEGGYNGARFPWESAFTGAEVTPDACPACRENQQHITGDIAWATRTYVAMTQDVDWLGETQQGSSHTGNELIVEMAKFWESRPTFSDEKQKWEINGVMPPDEHQESCNNSIYTNLVANLAVNTARWTTCLTEGEAAAFDTIPDSWLDKMAELVFLYNEEYEYHEEFEGFDEEYSTGTLDERGIKQADVVLLGFPLLWQMPDEVRRNDLELYEPITDPEGPAMTWGIFAINWIELGDEAKAEDLFYRSYEQYIKEPFKVWTEAYTGVGAVNFITGAGGFLQVLLFGYAGIRVHPYHLEFKESFLPPDTEALNLVGLQYLGAKFDTRLSEDEVTFTCYQEGETGLEVAFDDVGAITFPFVCNGSPQSFPRSGFRLYPSTPVSSCAVPRDEVDVDYGDLAKLRGKDEDSMYQVEGE